MWANIVLIIILSIVTYTDIKREEIDHWPLIVGVLFIIPYTLLGYNNITFLSSCFGALAGFSIFLLFAIFGGMGGGDVKLMAMIGFFVGLKAVLAIIYLSCVIGAVVGLIVIIIKKKKTLKVFVPFAPSIFMATLAYFITEGLGGSLWFFI